MSRLAALVFDVDGTLADTEELHRRAYNEAFRGFGLNWEWDPETYQGLLGVSGGPARIHAHIDRLAAPAAEKTRLRRTAAGLHAEKTRIYGELLDAGGALLRPGIAELTAEARAAGLQIGFVSSSASSNLVLLLARAFGTRAAPPAALASTDQVARKKPAPDVYELMIATLRLPATACVAFEDSQNGVLAAKAAGLFTVAVPSRWTSVQDLSAADVLLPSLAGLGLEKLEALRARSALREVRA